jgi:hypothetical protein
VLSKRSSSSPVSFVALPTAATPATLPTVALPTVALPTVALPTVALPTVALPTVALPTAAAPATTSSLVLKQKHSNVYEFITITQILLEKIRRMKTVEHQDGVTEETSMSIDMMIASIEGALSRARFDMIALSRQITRDIHPKNSTEK